MDLTKLGRSERVLAIVGLLAFIDSFLPWYSVSFKGVAAGYAGSGVSGNAWDVGFWAWFPLLLLLAVGVLLALPAFGQSVAIRGGFAAFGAVSALATIIILIRWLTYPSLSGVEATYVTAGADFGTYIGLALAVVATVFAYLGFTAAGGSINNFADAFKTPGSGAPAQFQAPGDMPQPPQPPGPWQQPPPQ